MNSCAAHLDGHNGIEYSYCCFEGYEVAILVREYSEITRVYTKTDAGRDILFGGLEPGITLCLRMYMKLGDMTLCTRRKLGHLPA